MFRRKYITGGVFLCVLVPVVLLITVVLQRRSASPTDEWRRALSDGRASDPQTRPSATSCPALRNCPEDHFSFSVCSGAAGIVPPKICVENKILLGRALNNVGVGINVVIINGKTGEFLKAGNFNMYDGEVKPLIELLKSIETGSVVLMASFDEPSTKLDEEARKLILELGSSVIQTLGFRDNWVFVGGKGGGVKSNFEKYLKNDNRHNKYENWPERIELKGCIPKFHE